MDEGHGPTNNPPESSSRLGSNSDDEAGDFGCNICFDLAQDPVITLCGHLYCWPCLYRWVRGHSRSHECPVCKALVDEEKVIPLYGRGKSATDHRLENSDGTAGQRAERAPPTPGSNFGMHPVFSVPFNNGLIDANAHGGSPPSGYYYYGYHDSFRDTEGQMNREAQTDGEKSKKIIWVIVFCVVIVFLVM